MASNNNLRVAVAAQSLSAAGFIGITKSESFTSTAVIPVKGDVPTIGFGTTEGVKMGDTITVPQALDRAMRDVNKFEDVFKKCVKVPLYQYEYDAYISLEYNIGQSAFCGSTLVKKLNAKDYDGACRAILDWDKFKGKPLEGLTIRRQREYQTCIGNE